MASGLLHVLGAYAHDGPLTAWDMPLLILSRMLHGFSTMLFPLT